MSMKKLYIFFSFIFLSANVTTETKQLNFLYTNDLHAHLQPHIEQWISKTRPVGGFANLATLIKEEHEDQPLFMDDIVVYKRKENSNEEKWEDNFEGTSIKDL